MLAEFRSKCAVCGDWIEEGDEIEPDEDGNWVHSFSRRMNLYLISQSINNDYDTYDSAVVVAPNEATAKLVHPKHKINPVGNPNSKWNHPNKWWETDDDDVAYWGSWVNHPDQVEVEYIGMAKPSYTGVTVILASFNAG